MYDNAFIARTNSILYRSIPCVHMYTCVRGGAHGVCIKNGSMVYNMHRDATICIAYTQLAQTSKFLSYKHR